MRLQPAWEQKCVQTLHDGRSTVTEQRPHCPADCSKRRTGSCDWGDRTICRRFGGRHQQTIGPSRMDGTPTRLIGDGATENARPENAGLENNGQLRKHSQGLENAGLENDG